MLTINMLGKANISFKGTNIDDKLNNKLVALICLLVLNKNRNISKDKIVSYLWPDSNDEAAKSNLRFNLWTIKKVIPQDHNEDFIISKMDYCRINEKYKFYCDKIALDYFKASRDESIEELIKLKELFKGDFLEGLYIKNCNDFNEMILFERVVCQNKQVEILERLVSLYEEQDAYEDCLQILNEVAAIEPYNEHSAYQIMNMYGKLGNRVAAINYYKKFESNLRRNLNISPDNELKILYASLLENSGGIKAEHNKTIIKKKKIEVKSHCLKNVEYFWVADVIKGIMENVDKKYLLELDKSYIFDLSFIQNDLLLDYEKLVSNVHESIGFVPSVRIINAFVKFLKHTSDIYEIRINVVNIDDMDGISQNILKHIEELKIEGICFDY